MSPPTNHTITVRSFINMKKISESRRLASLAFLLSGLLFIVPALYAAPDKTRTAAPAKKKAATQPASAGKTNSSVVRAKTPAPVRNPRITLSDNALRDQARLSINRDDVTGEDMFVREAALNALGNHAGSVVVMNPNTGQIYSIVNQDWAVRSAFKPATGFSPHELACDGLFLRSVVQEVLRPFAIL